MSVDNPAPKEHKLDAEFMKYLGPNDGSYTSPSNASPPPPSSSFFPSHLEELSKTFFNPIMVEKYFHIQESILLQLQQMQQQIRSLEEQMLQFSTKSFGASIPKSTSSVGTNTSFPVYSINLNLFISWNLYFIHDSFRPSFC